jgi:ribosomal protein S27AE/ribosomal protein L37E
LSEAKPEAGAASARQFPCPSCGADLVWSPAKHRLACGYCGYEAPKANEAIPGIPSAPAAVVEEVPLVQRLARAADLGWGAERKSVRCSRCGAGQSFEPGVAASACAFCGSPAVVEAPAGSDAVRPDGVLAFRIEKRDAIQRFRSWLASLWFRPNALRLQAALTAIQGIYLPFWTFDADSRSRWSAEAGYRRGSGKNARVEWRPVSGTLDRRFDDLPLPASRGLDAATAREIEPFPTGELVPYEPGYLSGFLAEEFAIGLTEAHAAARERMDATLRTACRREVPGQECRNLRVDTVYSNWAAKSGLLPIWIAAYEFRGKSFRYVVNGATGSATGTAPWSWVKVGLAALVILAIALFVLSNS